MIRKRNLPLALLLALGLTAASGCAPSTGGSLPELTGELNLHCSPYMDAWMDPAVAAFQEKFPEVQVNVENHSLDSWGADIEEVRTALMAGQGPDLVYRPEYFFPDIQKTMSSGVFADLNPFFAADPELSLNELETSVLTVGQSGGKQLVLPLTYSIPMMFTSRELLAECGISETACRKNHLETLRQLSGFLERRPGESFSVYNRPHAMSYFPDYLGLSYLDYDKQTVDFSFPEFKEAAELYKDFYEIDLNSPEMEEGSSHTEAARLIQKRQVLFYDYMSTNGLTPLENARVLSGLGETPVLIPVRTMDGKTTASVFHAAAIRSGGNQRNAWEFLKILLSEETMNSNVNMRNFPIRKSCLSARLDKVLGAGSHLEEEDGVFTLAPLPEDVRKDYEAAYADLGHAVFSFGFLSGQVEGHLYEYYQGSKSLDACIGELTNDMEIMISE